MVGGAVGAVAFMLVLAWAREIVGLLVPFDENGDEEGKKSREQVMKGLVRWVAVFGVYGMDFAVNTVEAATRTFIVDCAPATQQEAANAMASRVISVGNVLGFLAGSADLPAWFPFLGYTQFQGLCALASISLGVTVAISTLAVREDNPLLEPGPSSGGSGDGAETFGPWAFLLHILRSARNLPAQIRNVCTVQFFAWIGYFAPLFYGSLWIGDLYAAPYLRENPDMSPGELDKLYEKATRVASVALLGSSCVITLTNLVLPLFVTPTYDAASAENFDDENESGASRWSRISERLRIPGFTLKTAWLFSLVIFSAGMFSAPLIRSVAGASVVMVTLGYTWALCIWAPFAIIGAEIRQGQTSRIRESSQQLDAEVADSQEDEPLVPKSGEPDETGVILGIHNVASTAPQAISTIISSIVFKIWQKPRGTPGDHSVAIVLGLSGVAGLVAASYVTRIRDGTEKSGQGEPAGEHAPRTRRSNVE
jgi:solute carrier family 45 protein 1/2/4